MPYRLVTFWAVIVGLVGMVVVGVLIATRRDWRRSVEHSTGWRRRLLVAGLAMLGGSGLLALPGCEDAQEPVIEQPAPLPPDEEPAVAESPVAEPALAETPEWQRIDLAWRDGYATLERKSIATEEAKEELQASLGDARRDVASLVASDLLSEAEGALLAEGLRECREQVSVWVPANFYRDNPDAPTCYIMAPARIAPVWERVEQVTPLLATLAEDDSVRPEVVEKVLQSLADELAEAEDGTWQRQGWIDHVMADQSCTQAEAEDIVDEKLDELLTAVVELQMLHERHLEAAAADITDTAEWQRVITTWWAAHAAVIDGNIETAEEKRELTEAINVAQTDLYALVAAGHLTEAERGLLAAGLEDWAVQVGDRVPMEMTRMCYGMGRGYYEQPAWQRAERVLPLLQSVADQDAVQAATLERILQSVEDELTESVSEGEWELWLQATMSRESASRLQAQETVERKYDELLTAVAELQVRLEAAQEDAGE